MTNAGFFFIGVLVGVLAGSIFAMTNDSKFMRKMKEYFSKK